MKKNTKLFTYLLIVVGLVIIITNSCQNEETTSKMDPVIIWSNPDDITFGTLLSENQLNATADVPGIFIYAPPIGTKLNEGADQDLKVDFTPIDSITYNTASKMVKINVIAPITVNDIDGNVYHGVNIGTQVWMVPNLKTTKYNDNTEIPLVTDATEWSSLSTPGYCWNNNDSATYAQTYGALYNWYTVETDKLCPTGWHVATDAEWTTLTDYLGDSSVAGGKLKETGTDHWLSPNNGATNETEFTALPGGIRNYDGVFYSTGNFGYWWTGTENSTTDAWQRSIVGSSIGVGRSLSGKWTGFSVRCVKD